MTLTLNSASLRDWQPKAGFYSTNDAFPRNRSHAVSSGTGSPLHCQQLPQLFSLLLPAQHCHIARLTDTSIPGLLLVLVLPTGHCGSQDATFSHGTRDVAFGWTQGGHGSAHAGWEKERIDSGAGGGCGACEPMCVPVVAAKLLGDSGGGGRSCSNMAAYMTELTLPCTKGFWGRCVVILWAGRGASSFPAFL